MTLIKTRNKPVVKPFRSEQEDLKLGRMIGKVGKVQAISLGSRQ